MVAGVLAMATWGLWAQRAEASGCKTGSEVYERAQFGTDLGLTLGGGAVAATGRFSILQVRRDPWVPAIDRNVPVEPAGGTEIASDVLLFSSYAAAAGWGIYVTVRCNREYTLRRSVATPLLEVAWPFLWTYGVGEVTKSFVGRPRPYTRGSEGFVDERDDFRSFLLGAHVDLRGDDGADRLVGASLRPRKAERAVGTRGDRWRCRARLRSDDRLDAGAQRETSLVRRARRGERRRVDRVASDRDRTDRPALG